MHTEQLCGTPPLTATAVHTSHYTYSTYDCPYVHPEFFNLLCCIRKQDPTCGHLQRCKNDEWMVAWDSISLNTPITIPSFFYRPLYLRIFGIEDYYCTWSQWHTHTHTHTFCHILNKQKCQCHFSWSICWNGLMTNRTGGRSR